MTFSVIRACALLFVLSLRLSLPYEPYEYIYIAFLFAHFALAVYYSRFRLTAYLRAPAAKPFFSSIGGLAVLSAFFQLPSVAVYFTPHYVFSETYTPLRRPRASSVARGIFALFVYLSLLNHVPTFSWIPEDLLLSAAIITYLFAAYGLFSERRAFPARETADLLLFETIALVIALLAPTGYVRVEDIIFYHVVFWIPFPLIRRREGKASSSLPYLGAMAALTIFFWLLTPMAGLLPGNYAQWEYLGSFFGSLHISLSFLLSQWNPDWLKSILRHPLPSPAKA